MTPCDFLVHVVVLSSSCNQHSHKPSYYWLQHTLASTAVSNQQSAPVPEITSIIFVFLYLLWRRLVAYYVCWISPFEL